MYTAIGGIGSIEAASPKEKVVQMILWFEYLIAMYKKG